MKRKPAISVILFLLTLVVVAYAAEATLKLSSTQPLTEQFSSFRTYLGSLSISDQEAWVQELTTLVAETNTGANNHQNTETGKESTVWVSKSGKKYHLSPDCSGMKNPRKMTLDEALSHHYSPCSKCVR